MYAKLVKNKLEQPLIKEDILITTDRQIINPRPQDFLELGYKLVEYTTCPNEPWKEYGEVYKEEKGKIIVEYEVTGEIEPQEIEDEFLL